MGTESRRPSACSTASTHSSSWVRSAGSVGEGVRSTGSNEPQTTRERLPDDFGLAESNYRFGHVDAIVPRAELRAYVARLLRLFRNGADRG